MREWGLVSPDNCIDFEGVMAKTSPGLFVRQVRQEVAKVTWPSRKETTTSTIMVFIMVTIAAIFFLVVDWVMATGVKFLFSAGG